MVETVAVETDVPTRECLLKAGRTSARVFPIALPSERVMSTAGAFGPGDAYLELKQVAIGGLYAPLVIDWEPGRRQKGADWRTLTVTEQGRILKSDAAAGHRLRLGDHQLFIYRSLTRSHDPRAILGHHTTHETVFGKFDSSGEVEPILLVE